MGNKKFLIVASKIDPAGMNILNCFMQYQTKDVMIVNDSILYERNLNLDEINKYNFIIFASKHQSEKSEKTLSIHTPGNFRNASAGGQLGKVSLTSAIFLKQIFERLNVNAQKIGINYNVTLEATHHGPLIKKPCLFIEIGSTISEWKDKKAGFLIARTIYESILNFKDNPYNEIAVGIGGPHYCPNFNKIQNSSNVAISHIIPGYALPITQEMILEVIQKTLEEVDFALLDWKGLGPSQSRQEIINILEKNHIYWKKTSEINKNN